MAMTREMKTQATGLTIVAIMLAAAGIIIAVWATQMADNSLMGASPKYKPTFPAVKTVDITQAPQCAEGYDKKWIGCQSLAQ
jgi:hypothetical protein